MAYLKAYDTMDGRSSEANKLRSRAKLGEAIFDVIGMGGKSRDVYTASYDFEAEASLIEQCKAGECFH